jgi:hypothetical protein
MPIGLSDDEYRAVIGAAQPIHPTERANFLRELAAELERHAVVGPGLVHRLCADLQRRFAVGAHSQIVDAERRPSRANRAADAADSAVTSSCRSPIDARR